ncbi:helix-turn-helix transcriptional regulator [Flavobacterium aciduliphilum]|uniref:HTH cro/C1-type domain-containing protein n=1 Tax=Flavobacterium aciduliphilum TaxID=1101402 RepID=A0A328YN61_9FLAO|nr:helix-turn-helix transcriptional regulator [Flavobacterium aciduliphilum]RAR71516.1 hypothetical protein CLV55_10772 [Flavobacterium aciduliphilum]
MYLLRNIIFEAKKLNQKYEFYLIMEDSRQYDLIISKIATKLKKLRIEKGYTSYENFAHQHDLSRIQYWRMEKGTNFTIKNLLKILEIHQISLEDFFSEKFED